MTVSFESVDPRRLESAGEPRQVNDVGGNELSSPFLIMILFTSASSGLRDHQCVKCSLRTGRDVDLWKWTRKMTKWNRKPLSRESWAETYLHLYLAFRSPPAFPFSPPSLSKMYTCSAFVTTFSHVFRGHYSSVLFYFSECFHYPPGLLLISTLYSETLISVLSHTLLT